MKNIFKTLLVTISVLLMNTSCNNESTIIRPSAQGAAYEMFVICAQPKWEGEIGDTLRNILEAPIPMLNQIEPHFDLSRVNPSSYEKLVRRHRNQIVINTGKKYKAASMGVQYDIYAAPQIIVTITAPNDSILTNYIWQNRKELLQVFMMAERDREIKINKTHYTKQIDLDIQAKFNFSMKIPKGYAIRIEDEGVMWLTNENPLGSVGIVIYEYPYTDVNDLKLKNIVEKRNKFTSIIQGTVEGTYMTTAEIEPDIRYTRVHNRAWAEVHGFWDLKNDFMGGPFVSYSTIDKRTKKVICIDGYVQAEGKDKRNAIRKLEHLIYTVTFPDASKESTITDSQKTK